MKKLFAVAVAMAVAGSASAASVGFTFGTNFYRAPAVSGNAVNGQNFAVNWNLDNDLSLGYYTETNPAPATSTITAIQIGKGVMKNVSVGLNLGQQTATTNGTVGDIWGMVNILSGSGDKVSGNLVATAAARFSNALIGANDPDGYNLNLAVNIGF